MNYKGIVLEGTDGIGKSTLSKELRNLNIQTYDRDSEFTGEINLDTNKETITNNISEILNKNKEKLFIILHYDGELGKAKLANRINKRDFIDEFDNNYDKYNDIYKNLKTEVSNHKNIKFINIEKNDTPYEILQIILQEYFNEEIQNILNNHSNIEPTLEGESKKYFRLGESNVAVAQLKPSIFSFTHSRYENVEGVEIVRNKIWGILGNILNKEFSHFKFNDKTFNKGHINNLISEIIKNKDDIFLSNLIKTLDDKHSLVVFENEIAENIEVVFKKYFVGTWKHNLLNPEKYQTRNENNLKVGDKLPNEIIRFDWRNPVFIDGEISKIPDWTIPDDFADLYIDVDNAKNTAHLIGIMLEYIFKEIGIETVDGCYFMNKQGNRIHSEITPDGLRIKLVDNMEDSFDKDLWREGQSKKLLTKKWKQLYEKLKDKFNY